MHSGSARTVLKNNRNLLKNNKRKKFVFTPCKPNKEKIIFGKLSIKYSISRNKELDLITKYNYSNEKDISDLLFNGVSTLENVSSKNQL